MERLIDFSLKNRLLMIILTIIIIAGGYYSYRKLPVDAFRIFLRTWCRYLQPQKD